MIKPLGTPLRPKTRRSWAHMSENEIIETKLFHFISMGYLKTGGGGGGGGWRGRSSEPLEPHLDPPLMLYGNFI